LFVQRLCAEDGIAWHHQHSPQGHLLVFTEDQTYFPKLRATPFQHDTGMAAEHPVVSQFSLCLSTRTSTTTRRGYDLKRPSALLESHLIAEFSPELEDYRFPVFIENEKRGKQLVRQALERHRVDYQLAEGRSDQAFLRSGHFLDLTEHPRKTYNDLWLLLSVSHRGKQPQSLEESASSEGSADDGFTQGYRNQFTAIPWDVAYRPPLPAQRPALVSQTARVTGPSGEDVYCDEHGRVKIQFHWDRAGFNSERSSCWVRVSSSWAGDGFGSVTIPRVGMEVVVTFLEGNPDHPLITGCVPNKSTAVPYPLPANKTRSVFRSRSSPHTGGYNELTIEDRAGQELIYLRAQRNLEQTVLNDSRLEVGNERRAIIQGDDSLQVAGNRHARIGKALIAEAGEQVHINAGTDLVLEAARSITLRVGDQHIVINGDGVFSSKVIEDGGSPASAMAARALLPGTAVDVLAPPAPLPSGNNASDELEEEEEEVELGDETPTGITLRIGMFFDGTGNNKANSETVAACYAPDADLADAAEEIQKHCAAYGYDGEGNSPDNSYGNDVSNIARLYELYGDQVFDVLPNGAKRAFVRVYIEGIGTHDNGEDSLYSQMTGRGETGVVARVEESPEKIIARVRMFQENNPAVNIEKIEFDVFGFSRGAAAARHFVNEVLKNEQGILAKALPADSSLLSGSFKWDVEADVAINFIGLFDTVAAIANPRLLDFSVANNRNPGVNLRLPEGCAKKVVHLVARDEIRENFALNSAGSVDLPLPGSHSDLGGGYLPQAKEKLLLGKPVTSRIPRDSAPTRSGAYLAAEKEVFAWYEKGVVEFDGPGNELRVALWERALPPSRDKKGINPGPEKEVFAVARIERPVRGELSLVYLRIMRELALRHDVPFDIIDEHDPKLALPTELEPIHKKLQAYALGKSSVEGLTIAERALLRSRYIHLSAHWNAYKDLNSSGMNIVFVNRPANNNKRVVHPNE
jgi:type VI secretion system secreted protein VgrG